MQWHGLKIPVIIAAMLAGMAVLFAVQWAFQSISYEQPLNAALHDNEAVESYQIATKGQLVKISVAFKYDADLMEAYKQVQQDLTRVMGKRRYELDITDSRDDVLKGVWYQSQFAVYQALAQGNYLDMQSFVEREAGSDGVDARIDLDQNNIYLRFKREGHTMDQVLARAPAQVSPDLRNPAGGGGSFAQRG
ncbi:MAG: hypothetical protein ACYC0Q_03760 [Eubacteriales bacterium]